MVVAAEEEPGEPDDGCADAVVEELREDGVGAEEVEEEDPAAGHEDAQKIYRLSGDMLGRGLAILVDLLNPERIVIGSVFARSERLLREAMEKRLAAECLPISLRSCQIVPAALGDRIGDYAALCAAEYGLAEEKHTA